MSFRADSIRGGRSTEQPGVLSDVSPIDRQLGAIKSNESIDTAGRPAWVTTYFGR